MLPPEYLLAGAQRTDEFSVDPDGELGRVKRIYPSSGEVRFVPLAVPGRNPATRRR